MTHQPVYWEHEGNKAVRDGKYKLVSRFPDSWELYDMEADRTELRDLASAQPERQFFRTGRQKGYTGLLISNALDSLGSSGVAKRIAMRLGCR